MGYIEAADTIRARDLKTVLRHVLPSIMAPLIVLYGLGVLLAAIARPKKSVSE